MHFSFKMYSTLDTSMRTFNLDQEHTLKVSSPCLYILLHIISHRIQMEFCIAATKLGYEFQNQTQCISTNNDHSVHRPG